MFTHNVYDNIRTRVIVVHDGRMLLHAAAQCESEKDAFRCLPGGGIEPNESLYECGAREVLEETGIKVKVTSVAFLREWIVPKMVPVEEMRREAKAWGFTVDDSGMPDHGYGIEVYLWASLAEGESGEPKPGDHKVAGGVAEWVPLEQVVQEPLFPAELKALARDLAGGRRQIGVPSFVTGLGSPWDEPDWSAFKE